MLRRLLLAGLSLPIWLCQAGQCRAGAAPSPVSSSLIADGHDGASWKADVLQALEIKVGGIVDDDARSFTVTTSRAALLQEVPTLQAHGALTAGITSGDVEKHPASYSNAVALLLMSYAVRSLYAARPDFGVTRWKVMLLPMPGNAARGMREMFSFALDRLRYQGIDWDKLAFTEFPHAVAGFSYNLRFTSEMSHELDGSIGDD